MLQHMQVRSGLPWHCVAHRLDALLSLTNFALASLLPCLVMTMQMHAGRCKLDMMLYTPQGSPPPYQPPMHPLNALRNKAIAAAQTEVTYSMLALLLIQYSVGEKLLHAYITQHVAHVAPCCKSRVRSFLS